MRKKERGRERYKDRIIDVGFFLFLPFYHLPFGTLAEILPFPKCEIFIGVCLYVCAYICVDICVYFCSSRVPRRASSLAIISQF